MLPGRNTQKAGISDVFSRGMALIITSSACLMYSNVSKTGSEVPQKVNENMKLYVTVSIKS